MNALTAALISLMLAAFGGASIFGNPLQPAGASRVSATSSLPCKSTDCQPIPTPMPPTPTPTPTPFVRPPGGPGGNPDGPGGGGHPTCPPGWYLTASNQCERVTYY